VITTIALPPDSSSTSTAAAAQAATCDPNDLVQAVNKAVTGGADNHTFVTVAVDACQGGFAQLVATGDTSGCAPDGTVGHVCSEPQRMWLKAVNGVWTLLDAGTGVTCAANGPMGRSPSITEACNVLFPT
jgi:hypothetical protein